MEMNVNDILEIIDSYYKQYSLPEMNISDGEFQSLIDNLKECLTNNNRHELIPAMNIIIRRAINLALLERCDVITLYYFASALDDLRAFSIPEEEINELKFKVVLDGLKNNSKKTK